jgi:hypothetical protein
MTHNKKFALLLVAAFVVCAALISAPAQGTNARAATAEPAQTNESKPVKARFEVLHMLYNSIQVRSLVDQREIHTFTYSDQIRDQMQKLFDQGGYQYGDKVTIWYQPGKEVALKIKGKPSKPL